MSALAGSRASGAAGVALSDWRRVVAEVVTDEARPAFPLVGSRSIHQCWSRLAPHYQTILLPPQRRSDDRGVTWTWQQPAEPAPPSAVELAEVRRRLASATQALAQGLAEGDEADQHSLAAELVAVMQKVVGKLTRKNDSQLAAFVGRTATGLMLHSWGAAQPARPVLIDDGGYEVSGTLLTEDVPAAAQEVVIENRKGLRIARSTSDAAGVFSFKGVGPGSYRVRVNSDRLDFPVHGLELTVEHAPVTGLILRSHTLHVDPEAEAKSSLADAMPAPPAGERAARQTAAPTAPEALPPPTSRRRIVYGWWVAGGLVAAGGVWVWLMRPATPRSVVEPDFPVVAATPAAAAVGNEGAARSVGASVGSSSFTSGTVPGGSNSGGLPIGSTPAGTVERASASDRRGVSGRLPFPNALSDPAASAPPTEFAGASTSPLEGSARLRATGAAEGDPKVRAREEAPDRREVAKGSGRREREAAGRTDREEKDPVPAEADTAASPGSKPAPQPRAAVSPRGARSDKVISERETPSGARSDAPVPPEAASGGGSLPSGAGSARQSGAVRREITAHSAAAQLPSPKAANSPPGAGAAGSGAAVGSAPPAGAKTARVARTSGVAGGAVSTPAAATAAAGGGAGGAAASSTTSAAVAPGKKAASTVGPVTPPSPKQPPPPGQDPKALDSAAEAVKEAAAALGALSPAAEADAPVLYRAVIHTGGWQPRLVRDVIVATPIVRVGDEDRAEALRAALAKELLSKLPATVRRPKIHRGVRLELAVGGVGAVQEPMRWRGAGDGASVEARVNPDGADLPLPGEPLPPDFQQTLVDGNGHTVARVSGTADGGMLLKAAASVRCWYWMEVEIAAGEVVAAGAANGGSRFEWRLAPNRPLPGDWVSKLPSRDGRALRLLMPLRVDGKGRRNFAPALVDNLTGWAAVGEMAVASASDREK